MTLQLSAIAPRKRPRQARSAATVELILEGAARILEAGGLAAFNTNALAARAGVSIGSLYQYFPSKEAILAEMIRRKRARLLEDIRAQVGKARGCDLASAVDGLVRAGLAHRLHRPQLALSLEYAEIMLPIDGETRALKQEIVAEVANLLAMHGVIDPWTSARDVAALTRGMIDAAGLFGETDPGSLERRVSCAVMGYLQLTAPAQTC